MTIALAEAALRQLFPRALDGYISALVNGGRLFEQYGVTTPLRMAHFLAQAAAETGGFSLTEESGNYSAERLLAVFPHHFSRAQAIAYACKPQMILSRAYAGRLGNGGELSGDGWRYRGRGMCQLTGKANYAKRALVSGFDLAHDPNKAGDPFVSLKIWCAEWAELGLAAWADKGPTLESVLACARGINCGDPASAMHPNGLPARRAWFAAIWKALGDGSDAAVFSPEALADGDESEAVKTLQEHLAALHYPIGMVDGIYGERTKAAVTLYQAREGFQGDPPGRWIVAKYGPALAAAKPFENGGRANVTLAGLRNMGDAPSRVSSLGKRAAALLGGGSALTGAVSQTDPAQLPQMLQSARAIVEPVQEQMQWAAQHWYLAAGMLAALLYVLFHRAAEHRVAEVNQGRGTP